MVNVGTNEQRHGNRHRAPLHDGYYSADRSRRRAETFFESAWACAAYRGSSVGGFIAALRACSIAGLDSSAASRRLASGIGRDAPISIPLSTNLSNPGILLRTDGLVSLIDDDESVRESLTNLLRAFGFNVRAFDSAEAFLEADVVEETCCVILDVAMPGMSGPELFDHLKQRPRILPVIFITAQNSNLGERLVELGAVACLQKPFDPMALVGALQHTLGSRRGL